MHTEMCPIFHLIFMLYLPCLAIFKLKRAQVYIKQVTADFSISESTVLVYIKQVITMFLNKCIITDIFLFLGIFFFFSHIYRDISLMKFLAIYRISQISCIVIVSVSRAKYRHSIESWVTRIVPPLVFMLVFSKEKEGFN